MYIYARADRTKNRKEIVRKGGFLVASNYYRNEERKKERWKRGERVDFLFSFQICRTCRRTCRCPRQDRRVLRPSTIPRSPPRRLPFHRGARIPRSRVRRPCSGISRACSRSRQTTRGSRKGKSTTRKVSAASPAEVVPLIISFPSRELALRDISLLIDPPSPLLRSTYSILSLARNADPSTINLSWIILLFADPLRVEKNGNLGARISFSSYELLSLLSLSLGLRNLGGRSSRVRRPVNVHLRFNKRRKSSARSQ